MNIDPNGGSTILGDAPAGQQSQEAIDKEAFLKLLVTQMQNQDPLSPMEGTDFVSQMATFSQVEQQVAQSEALELISVQLTGLANNEAISLVGKDVTIRGNKIAFDGTNTTGSSATLGRSADEVSVTIRDEQGNAVRTMDLGPQPGGTINIPWDGTDDNGQPVPSGGYSMDISATKSDGEVVQVSQDVTGRVVGVSFDKGYPELLLDSGARAPISDLISVAEAGGYPNAAPSTPPNYTTPTALTNAPADAGVLNSTNSEE